jgi:muramidase (phage lysozyme)
MADTNPYLEGFSDSSSMNVAEANMQAYLDGLGKAEHADYDTIVGNKKFTDYSKHPGIVGVTTDEGPSTAAGKYQIVGTTYKQYAKKLGITDFTPESQDKIARAIIKDKGAEEDIKKGDFEAAHAKLGSTWASLPTSPYSQPKRSTKWVEENIKPITSADGNAEPVANIAQPQQVLDRPTSSDNSNPYLEGFEDTESNPYLKGFSDKEISKTKSFTKSFIGGAAEKIAASPGMVAGARVGAELGLKTGEFAPIAVPVLGLAGGIGGYLGGAKVVETAYDKYFPESIKKAMGYDKATREAERQANPESSFGGELASNVVLFRPGAIEPIALPGGKAISSLAQRATLATVSGGLEAGSEALSGEPLSAQRIAEATAFGGISAKPTSITTYADKLAANLIKKIPGTSEYVPSTRTAEQPTPGTKVSPQEAPPEQVDLFQKELDQATEQARNGRVFKPGESNTTPIDAIIKSEQEIELNKMEAKQIKSQIEEALPDVRNRNQVTMHIEGERSYDKLYTDIEKAEELLKMKKSMIKQERVIKVLDENIIPGWKNIAEHIKEQTKKGIPLSSLDKEYIRLRNKKGFPIKGTTQEQIEFIAKNIEKVSYAHDTLAARPSDEPAFNIKDRVVKMFNRMGLQAQREGLFPQLRRDYVTHALDFTDSVLNRDQQRALSDYLFANTQESRFVRDFSQARQFRYIRDLEDALRTAGDALGLNTRGVKVQRDIAKIMEIYKTAMGRAIIEKRLANYLLKTKVDGSPFSGSTSELPIVTKDLNLGFKNNYVKFTGRGADVLGDVMVHPDFKDVLGFAFKQDDPGLMLEAFKSVSMLSKFLNTVGSLFHATSLGVASMTAAPGRTIKEIFTGGAGIRQALRDLEHNGVGEQGKLLIRNGLKVATEDVQRTIFGDLAGSMDRLAGEYLVGRDVKLARRLTDPLEQHFINHMNRFTWDYMHAANKLHLAQHFFTQIKAKHPEIADDKIAAEVASFVNNTLGGLNWAQVTSQVENKFLKGFAQKAMKLENRDWAQTVLFAPDWTVSTLRSFTRALPKELMKPQNWQLREGFKGVFDPKTGNDLARRYVLSTAALWLTILNGVNYAFTGRPIWTNKDPTRVELGDGTSMQMAKHSMEAAEWLRDPEKTLGNKLGFLPKAVITMTTGKAYPSPKAPMVKDNTALGRATHSLKAALPFQVSAAMSAPPGEKAKRAIASFVGTPIYGQTDKAHSSAEVIGERKAKRKETKIENRMKKLEQQ